MPSETKQERRWRTRPDPFDGVWEEEIEPLLRGDPSGKLKATTIIEWLAEQHPGRFSASQLRTLQRRLQDWRALNGPDREVYFPQEHPPGTGSADRLHPRQLPGGLGVTVAGRPYPHLLLQLILSRSGWRYAEVAVGETFLALTVSGEFDATSDDLQMGDLLGAFPLPWFAYVRLLSVRNEHARAFYEAEALRGGWSVRQLDRQIGSQFYERTALSKNRTALLASGQREGPEDVVIPGEQIRDPFVLEFLDLKDEYSESDLEEALIQHLETFLLELGDDFCFIGGCGREVPHWRPTLRVTIPRQRKCHPLMLQPAKLTNWRYRG